MPPCPSLCRNHDVHHSAAVMHQPSGTWQCCLTSYTAKGIDLRWPWRLYTQSAPLLSRPQGVLPAGPTATLPISCSSAAASQPISLSLQGQDMEGSATALIVWGVRLQAS